MKEAKKQYYNTEILNCLIDGDIVSTQQIADAVGMSENLSEIKFLILMNIFKRTIWVLFRKSLVLECG